MRSIRSFLITVTVVAIILVLFVAIVQGYRTGIERTQALLDEQLLQDAQLIALTATSDLRDLSPISQLEFQVWRLNGELIQRSSQIPSEPILPLTEETVVDTSFAGQRWRALNYVDTDRGMSIQVAESIQGRFNIAEEIVNATLLPILFGVPILIGLTWGIVSMGLRHLLTLARAVALRGTDNLEPINMPGTPSELHPVLASMNNMLEQLAGSFEREKRFASDAAHELRTPISALKVNVYNLRTQMADSADLQGLANSLDRMTHLIDQLLLLYRTSSENLRTDFESVNLNRLCQEVVRDRYTRIQQRQQDIELTAEDLSVLGNQFALSALVANLVDNASKYTPEGGHIRLEVTSSNEGVCLVVEDSGIGISPNLRERVKDRFFRVNTGSKVQGCGLGLSIVQHVVNLHHADFEITDSSFETGTRVAVHFPINRDRSQ